MKRCLLLLFTALPQCASIPKVKENSMSIVQNRLDEAYRQMAAADLDGLMKLYEPDAVIQSPNEPAVIGTAAIRAFWQRTFDSYRVQLVPKVVETTDFAEIVVVRGRAVGAMVVKGDGRSVPVDVWFAQIYRRQANGTLRFWRGANGPSVRTMP